MTLSAVTKTVAGGRSPRSEPRAFELCHPTGKPAAASESETTQVAGDAPLLGPSGRLRRFRALGTARRATICLASCAVACDRPREGWHAMSIADIFKSCAETFRDRARTCDSAPASERFNYLAGYFE